MKDISALSIAYKNIKYKALNSWIVIALFAFGVLLISLIIGLNKSITQKFENNLAGIDLVIGAKGSPLQMVLCNMYHIDAPTGNITVEEVKAFFNPKHPLISCAVPLSLGDNYKGYRIVGTDQSFLSLYNLEVELGEHWHSTFDVLVGSEVARRLNIDVGDTFYSGHGLMDDDSHIHDHGEPFRVCGVLAHSTSVADQLILCLTEAVWKVHDHGEESDHHDHDEHEHHEHNHEGHDHHHVEDFDLLDHPDKEITSVLVQFRGRNFQTLNMQRNINQNTDLQAATPAIEVNRVFNLLGFGFDLIRYVAIALMLVSSISVFLTLLANMSNRLPDLALQRAMGARRTFLFRQIVLEGAILGFLGGLIGLMLSFIAQTLIGNILQDQFRYSFGQSFWQWSNLLILLVCVILGVIAALYPAWKAYKISISGELKK